MHKETVKWGGLTSIVAHDLPTDEKPTIGVVLCHGYGAPGTDLADLAQPLLTGADAKKIVFIFPAAPLDLGEQGIPGGRAWWHLDLDRLINRRTPEVMERFRRDCPDGLVEAREALVWLLGEAGRHFGLTADRIVLGGFSQGSMLATDVALRLKKPPAGLCILSGGLINEAEWLGLAEERGPLNVLQSHGRYDSILPFSAGEALRDLLSSAGASVDFYGFGGDHEIPFEVLHRLSHFVRDVGRTHRTG
jgi:phospholipase/carboxylesterase